ncbi:lantibiotic dehydratase [Streptomyces uncialis]|uniref:lantibiotic dehydratase n=1 Tax=Streptomyces uncialis TaxID=1048205 RepID=UPI00364A2083
MGALFAFGPVAMARIPLLPADTPVPQREGLLEEGLFLASRPTAAAPVDSARAAATRAAYAIRAGNRTTPHGVWCGVAAARLDGGGSLLRLGERHRAFSVPGAQWLLGYADRMLDEPGVVEALRITANNLASRRGDRFEAEHPGRGAGGQLGSVRVTALSEWLMSACDGPVPGAGIIDAVVDRYPGATRDDARTALVGMIRTGLLLTDLLPGNLHDDPLAHLVRKLPGTLPGHRDLVRVRELLHGADRHPPGAAERMPLLRAARDLADRVHPVERALTVDTVADAEVRLPVEVGVQAARAAEVLWRISHRTAPLRAWSQRFTAVFGRHRAVPVLEAVDPALGAGPPGAADGIAAAAVRDERRDRVLAGLLAHALAHGRDEVELSEEHIQRLGHDAGPPPRSAEIHVRLLPEAGGALRLVVGRHAAQTAGSAAGRFASRLPSLGPGALPSCEGGPVIAEIVCRPLTAGTAGLTGESGFAPYRIPLGVPARDGDLRPGDLAVVSTGRHVMLWSQSLQRQVVPVLFSRITRSLLSPVAQLLHLIGHAGEHPWHTWSWGTAEVFPYTPRVTFRRTVLAPQRWLLPDGLVTAAARRSTWHPRLDNWLTGTRPAVPATVLAEESDRELPLDPRDTEHQEILRRTVLRGTRSVTEALGHQRGEGAMTGPTGRHLLELVIPLHRRKTAPAPPADPRTALRPRTADTHLPGTAWLSAALPVPDRHQDAVLRQLPPAPDGTTAFWLRYDTPALGPHLRLRYHAAPETLNGIRADLARWSAGLAGQGLSSGHLHHEPYVQETQRYGGPTALPAAESVFASDSALCLAALRHGADDDEHLVLAALSAAAITGSLASPAAARGGTLTRRERRHREHLRPLARTGGVPARLTTAWAARQDALLAYLARLPAPATTERCASDLVHLHCNRLLGPDPGRERIARSLATDLLHAHG